MKKGFDDKSWSFLIASPSFSGPVFEESVILLLEDNEDGSFGIIINKDSEKTLGELNPDYIGTALDRIEVFEGGPLSADRISLALCTGENNEEGSFTFGVAPSKAMEILAKNPDAKICAYMGYSSWTTGQLQREIEEGTWVVSNVDVNMMFEIPADEIWEELLLRECPKFEKLEPPASDPELN